MWLGTEEQMQADSNYWQTIIQKLKNNKLLSFNTSTFTVPA
jgi:hypothetical protein